MLQGLAGCVPPRVVANDELPAHWETDDAWVRRRTGIGTRHWVDEGTSTGDLALEAAEGALKSAGTSQVDMVLVATSTPDHPMPAMAPVLASKLGLGTVAAFDVSAVCSGFVYALATASGMIAAGLASRILLVAADVYSTLLAPDDRSAGVVFGDGAGAMVLRAGKRGEPGSVLAFDLGSDGEGHDLIIVPAGGARDRAEPSRYAPEDKHFQMVGRDVYQHAVSRMSESALAVLKNVGWTTDEVDRVVAHQANARILNAVGTKLSIPNDRVVSNISRVGNTGAASIPLALSDAVDRNEINAGDKVLLTAFGGGFTWGSAAMLWPEISTGKSN
ncbi:ketoacyl-ACP synthase III [Lentzea tibetensis]|uniref:Beta-ketoacyl-[acyl-carrier-protein] synthase III n=1 Tax=Lentzea tibetensis TaxID=2591470 RepID=A0A563ELM1_9PSEU|nr:beta-ketoacyl-ACP synthase III [Lentzea tibetensis]TWP48018.1 ketoacyl-ACP synthase III [Lentzea tibetensis]